MATLEWVKQELRVNYAKASRAGERAARTGPRATKVRYLAKHAALLIRLSNGAAFAVPLKLIPGLKRAIPRDIRAIEILGGGSALHWENLDLDLSVPALVSTLFESPTWMAELGRIGGRRSSAAKASAARKNGRKGGRPRLRLSATATS